MLCTSSFKGHIIVLLLWTNIYIEMGMQGCWSTIIPWPPCLQRIASGLLGDQAVFVWQVTAIQCGRISNQCSPHRTPQLMDATPYGRRRRGQSICPIIGSLRKNRRPISSRSTKNILYYMLLFLLYLKVYSPRKTET